MTRTLFRACYATDDSPAVILTGAAPVTGFPYLGE